MEQQSMVPAGMGYIGSQNNDTALAAIAGAAMTKNSTPYASADGSGLMSSLVMASMLGRRGGGLFGGDDSTGSGVVLADIRKDIGDAKTDAVRSALEAKIEACKTESGIQGAIQVQDTNNQVNFRNLDNKICETEKSAIVFSKDSVINALQVEARTADRMIAFERNADEQFCENRFNLEKVNTHLTHVIDSKICHLNTEMLKQTQTVLNQLAADKLDEKNDEILRLRTKNNQLEQTSVFVSQFAAINSVLVNLANQNQHLANQVNTFGNGNLTGQSATNNQVK